MPGRFFAPRIHGGASHSLHTTQSGIGESRKSWLGGRRPSRPPGEGVFNREGKSRWRLQAKKGYSDWEGRPRGPEVGQGLGRSVATEAPGGAAVTHGVRRTPAVSGNRLWKGENMRNGVHTTSTRARVGFTPCGSPSVGLRPRVLAILAGTAFAQPPQPEPSASRSRRTVEPQRMEQLQNEGCRDMLVRILEQLRMKADQTAEPPGTDGGAESSQAGPARGIAGPASADPQHERAIRSLDEGGLPPEPAARPAPPDGERQRMVESIRRMQGQLQELNGQLAELRSAERGPAARPPAA